MDARNDVILCVDVSGSVDQCEQYFRGIERLLDELEKICDDLPVICWSSDASVHDVRDFKDTRMKTRQGKGGTQPQYMVKIIDEVIMRRKTNKLKLVITTDGEMSSCDTSQFCENVRTAHFHDRIVDVQIHFIGNPEGMNTNLAHAFENVPITLAINEHVVRNDRKFSLLKDQRFTNFKVENISSLLDDLALELSVMPSNRKNKVAIKDMLEEIHKKYLKALDEEQSDHAKKPEDLVHQLLAEGKMDQLKDYYCDLFVKEKECIYDRKINKLYSMLFKDCVKCYELMYFIPSAANTECVKRQLASDDGLVFGGDSENNEMHCDYDREQFCAMYKFKPTLPVIQLQKVPLDGIVDGSVGYPFHEQRKLARCPLQLFEYVDYDNLEETILGDHISAEEFLKLSSNKQPFLNDFTFKSSRNTEAYGIMVYDYPKAIETDLYDDKNSELYKDKNELDENIVNHICCIVADYFLESQEIRGNKGLWAIALLYSIYNTDRVRQDEFLRRCVRYTIIRISLVFKCNLPVFSGVHPQIKTNIHDALCCALHIGSTAFEGQMNFIQKLGESSPIFVEMMKTIFKQHIPVNICLADWLSWRYLFKLSLDMRHRQLLEAIVKTKVQDWINTDSGPLLIEGKTNSNVYNDAIKSSSIETLYKMVKVLQENKLVNRSFNNSMLDGTVPESLIETKCLNIDPSEFPKHVKICETTCRPTLICSTSKKPWTECLPSELRKTERSFYNLFGVFSYKYKKYPTLDDMLSYLVSRFPHEVHYRNVKDILTDVIQSFTALDLDVEEFGKRFVASSSKEVRSQLEANCKCSAHV